MISCLIIICIPLVLSWDESQHPKTSHSCLSCSSSSWSRRGFGRITIAGQTAKIERASPVAPSLLPSLPLSFPPTWGLLTPLNLIYFSLQLVSRFLSVCSSSLSLVISPLNVLHRKPIANLCKLISLFYLVFLAHSYKPRGSLIFIAYDGLTIPFFLCVEHLSFPLCSCYKFLFSPLNSPFLSSLPFCCASRTQAAHKKPKVRFQLAASRS